jgi:hypothetical protein
LLIHFPIVAHGILELENSLVIFQKNKGICLWTKYTAIENNIKVDKNSFHGQGELKTLFETIDEIEFTKSNLILSSLSTKVNDISTENLFLGAFTFTE